MTLLQLLTLLIAKADFGTPATSQRRSASEVFATCGTLRGSAPPRRNYCGKPFQIAKHLVLSKSGAVGVGGALNAQPGDAAIVGFQNVNLEAAKSEVLARTWYFP